VTINDALMKDIVGWDVRTWSKAFRFWESTVGNPREVLDCLELGAGPGGPSLWLALQGHHVICSNNSATKQHALPLHSKYSMHTRIDYQDIDAQNIPYENRFDLIVFKSVLGGIGPDGKATLQTQHVAMRQILKALKPGGRLLFAENIRGSVLHRLARAVAYKMRRACWRFMTLAETREFLSGFRSYELHTTGVLAMLGVNESQRNALGAVDDLALNRITPASWQYLVYGVATK